MAIFPKIQSPCPYKGDLADILDGDMCRLCSRRVHDLTRLSDQERVALIQGCSEEICVSYALALRPAIAAAMSIAALGAPMTAAAQDLLDGEEAIVVTAGGITDPANVEYVSNADEAATPELPVVYEDRQAKQARPNSANTATDGSTSRPNLGQPVQAE
jgi:hypothetical protein